MFYRFLNLFDNVSVGAVMNFLFIVGFSHDMWNAHYSLVRYCQHHPSHVSAQGKPQVNLLLTLITTVTEQMSPDRKTYRIKHRMNCSPRVWGPSAHWAVTPAIHSISNRQKKRVQDKLACVGPAASQPTQTTPQLREKMNLFDLKHVNVKKKKSHQEFGKYFFTALL